MVSEVIQANTISLSVENCQLACKPGSVLPVCTRSDDHSSGTPVTKCFAQPTRAAGPEKPDIPRNIAPPLFGLAPGGVYLATLPRARCALTAPFHPYRKISAVRSLWHFPWGRPRRTLSGTVFPWSPDFPPPHPFESRGSGHPANWQKQAIGICLLRVN
jgi:hypothetical protein